MFCTKIRHYIFIVFGLVLFAGLQPTYSRAQSENLNTDIDPRLIEIVEEVRLRANPSNFSETNRSKIQLEQDIYAERRIQAAMRIQEAAYTKDPKIIRTAILEFEAIDTENALPPMARIREFYSRHAALIEENAPSTTQQLDISAYEETGSWLERYFALQFSWYLHTEANERQAALQKAQYGFKIITDDSDQFIYSTFAKAQTLSTLSHLHNMQGDVEFAIANSLEYLKLTKGEKDAKAAIDILNNLIFSHSLLRDHKSLSYLSDQLLEIEKLSPPSIPGLSELRASQAANTGGDFVRGLSFSSQSLKKASHPLVIQQATINQAVSLAGLNRKPQARKIISDSGLSLTPHHLLKSETSRDVIYLGFLLAQGEDDVLATQLYNRQLDVTAQKYFENSSQDTTAMVAELENSRERQAERDAAAAREAQLQALTIDRQRALNRTLIIISVLFGGAALASFLFMKFRVRIVGELEEKTIEAASAEKLKTEFLGMISHELRTPLNGIIGISDFLAHYHEDPDIRNKTGIVLKSGQELLSVVESLTDMARLDAGQLMLVPHDTDLSVCLAAVPEPWSAPALEKGLVFTHFVDPAITEHYIDEERLVQCLNILLSNAIRFTKAGRVHLHITADQSSENEISGLTAIVADTGQGMSELVQSRLFTPFMQADTSLKRTHMGTGLSLAIAYGLAEKMKGTLSVFSREGRGSEFKLQIPLVPAKGDKQIEKIQTGLIAPNRESVEPLEVTAKDAAKDIAKDISSAEQEAFVSDVPVMETAKPPQTELIDLMQPRAGQPALHENNSAELQAVKANALRILVVDNHESERRQVMSILKSHGHICRQAVDGFIALKALDQMDFDLIILDIHLSPMDGPEVLRRIRQSGRAYANIPVVVMTANDAVNSTAECMRAGAVLFLAKPIREDELLQTVNFIQLEAPQSNLRSAVS